LDLDVSRLLEFLLAWCWVTNFHDVKLLSGLSGFLLAEAEEGVLILIVIRNWDISESSSKTFEDLLLAFLSKIQLHVAADGSAFSLVDTNKVAPFLGAVLSVVHDLAICKLGLLLEDLNWSCLVKDAGMVDVLLSDDTEGVLVNPSPESYCLIDLNLLDLLFRVQVENLEDGLGALGGSQGNVVL
jgi:hypothetical protein